MLGICKYIVVSTGVLYERGRTQGREKNENGLPKKRRHGRRKRGIKKDKAVEKEKHKYLHKIFFLLSCT